MITEIIILLAVLITAISTTLIINFSINQLIVKKLNDKEDLKNSTPINILKSVIFISVSILISELNLSLQNISKVISYNDGVNTILLQSLSYYSIFILIFMLSFFLLFLLSYILFSVIFRGKDILIETVNNNYALLIFFIGLFLMMILAFKPNLLPILDYFIAYPTIIH
jgi:hypothetical protein